MGADLKRILLKQHIGAPCRPAVQIGDSVKRGSLLAVPEGLGALIHSGYAGTVVSVTDEAVTIQPADTQPDSFLQILPADDSMPAAVKAAGIVGMGGAGFPTGVKLAANLQDGYVLVNAAECEPLLGHNTAQLESQTAQTIRGVKYAMEICHAKKGIFAIKAKHEKAVEALDAALQDEADISIHLLPDLYPMGEERAVVREVLGTLLSPDSLPSAANAVVINVETVLRIAQAVEERRPCITKNITVVGKLKSGTAPHIFMDVPIGTTVEELIDQAGGIDGDYGEIILGGPFTGKAVTPDTPITKTTGGIIVTQPFENLEKRKLGILLCACGGNEARMRDLAEKMNGDVVLIQKCKQAVDIKGTLKCENPGNCPGQALKCLNFKKAGCQDILIGNCSDCTNTVMGSAPRLGLNVHHQTDHVLRTVGMEVMRQLKVSKALPPPKDSKQPEVFEPYTFTPGSAGGMLRICIEKGKDIQIQFECTGGNK